MKLGKPKRKFKEKRKGQRSRYIACLSVIVVIATAMILIGMSGIPRTPPVTQTAFVLQPTLAITPALSVKISTSNVTKLQQLARLGRGSTWNARWSPDGKWLAAAGWLGIWLYKADALDETPRLLESHSGLVGDIAFSPDGTSLASTGADQMVRLWDLKTGENRTTLTGPADPTSAVAFSPDGTMLAAGDQAAYLWLWNLKSSQGSIFVRNNQGAPISKVAFSPDGQSLAVAGSDTIEILNIKTKQIADTVENSGEKPFDFSPDGITLAHINQYGFLVLRDIKQAIDRPPFEKAGVNLVNIAYSPDSSQILSTGMDGALRLWDVKTGQDRVLSQGEQYQGGSITFSPDGTRLLHATGTVRVIDITSGKVLAHLLDHMEGGQQIQFSPDSTTLGVVDLAGTVQLWDVKKRVRRMLVENKVAYWGGGMVAFSPDGKIAASSGGNNYDIRIWDTATGQILTTLKGHYYTIGGLAFSRDGTTLASASGDNDIRIWDTKTWQSRAQFSPHDGGVYGLALSPDGKVLVTAELSGAIHLWDANSYQHLSTISKKVSSSQISPYVVYSPDGKLLADLWDDQVELSEINGTDVRPVSIAPMTATAMAFSPDSTLLALGGADGTVTFFDIHTRQILRTIPAQPVGSATLSVVFSPDGTLLATSGQDGTMSLWSVVPS